MSVKEIASTSTPVLVEATSEAVVSQIWFKTDPIERPFCYRAVQLQLQTDSSDQGHETGVEPGSWSWFELVILEDAHTDKPRLKDGKELVWRSHGNRTDPLAVKTSITRNFGIVFDRRQDLLDDLEVILRFMLADSILIRYIHKNNRSATSLGYESAPGILAGLIMLELVD